MADPNDANGHGVDRERANTQLRLLQTSGTRREWTLDARTRSLGRRGVAEAREILRRHQPPQPVDAYSKAS
jgi:hypothetical protein